MLPPYSRLKSLRPLLSATVIVKTATSGQPNRLRSLHPQGASCNFSSAEQYEFVAFLSVEFIVAVSPQTPFPHPSSLIHHP